MTPWLNEHALETSHTEMPFVKSGDHFESMKQGCDWRFKVIIIETEG